jgi:hypothetical protein
MASTKFAIAPMKVARVPKPGADFQIVEREIPNPGAREVPPSRRQRRTSGSPSSTDSHDRRRVRSHRRAVSNECNQFKQRRYENEYDRNIRTN